METVLLSMGYRQVGNTSRWAKPIGKVLFAFDIKTKEFFNLFYTASTTEVAVWSGEKYDEDCDFLVWLQSTEAYTRTDIHTCDKGFEFLSAQEQLTFNLN